MRRSCFDSLEWDYGCTIRCLTTTKEFEVSVTRDASGLQIVFDDEDRQVGLLGDYHRTQGAGPGEDQVVAFGAYMGEAIFLENALKDFPGNGAKLGHWQEPAAGWPAEW